MPLDESGKSGFIAVVDKLLEQLTVRGGAGALACRQLPNVSQKDGPGIACHFSGTPEP
jgi:hypothetical protein